MAATSDPDAAVDVDDAVDELAAASAALAEAEATVADHGERDLERVAAAHREATDLLERYEGRATGTGDFEAYVEFQDAFLGLVEGLDDDLPAREAFEAASETVDQRRLSESDFAAAREDLSPAAERAALLDRRRDARDRLERAVRDARDRLGDVDERIGDLERLERLADVDLDAPVGELRDAVESYNDAVEAAFGTFRREASARDLLSFVESTAAFPLVEYRQPPAELREYVERRPAGEESVPQLLTYADYSRSKLDHYVDDAGKLKTRVAVHRTYLERLDAGPLSVSWPPPPADELRYRLRELESAVSRFADDDVVAELRALRALAGESRYGRLREAALAREELSEAERERVQSGDVGEELARLRDARERLAAALDERAR
jgi:hypothetical protein